MVNPAAAERPHWQWNLPHLLELCVVSQIELDPPRTRRARPRSPSARRPARSARAAGAAPGGPYRAPRAQAHSDLLCERCADVVDSLPAERQPRAKPKTRDRMTPNAAST